MPSITLEDVPEPLFREIRRRAEQHSTTVDNEIIACLEESLLHVAEASRARILQEAREARARVSVELTDEFLAFAKNQGRP